MSSSGRTSADQARVVAPKFLRVGADASKASLAGMTDGVPHSSFPALPHPRILDPAPHAADVGILTSRARHDAPLPPGEHRPHAPGPTRLAYPASPLPRSRLRRRADASARRPSTSSGCAPSTPSNPIGIDEPAPRLSWMLHAERRGTMQSAYEMRVAPTSAATLRATPLWSSGKVDVGRVGEPCRTAGRRSSPGTATTGRCARGTIAAPRREWSAPAFWETGLMGADAVEGEVDRPRSRRGHHALESQRRCSAPTSRSTAPIASARAYVTSLGLYEMQINGRRVGDQVLAPGWTSYDKRLQYQTLRRHRSREARAERGRRHARRRLVSRPARLGEAAQHVRQQARAARADRRALHRRPRAGHRDGRRAGRRRPGRSSPPTSTTARRTTRASRSAAGAQRRLRRRATGRACASSTIPRDEHRRAGRSADPPHRGDQADQGAPHAGWRDGVRHGPEHGRLGAAHACADPPAPRSGCGTPRCSTRRATSTRPTSAPRSRTDTLHAAGRRRGDLRAALHLPRLPLRGGRGLPGHADARARSPASSCTPTCRAPARSPARTRCSTSSTTTSSGGRRATSSACRPTVRSATSGSAGRATRRCSRARPRSTSTSPASSRSGCGDLAADQRQNGSLPDVIPDVLSRGTGRPGTSSAGWGDATVIVPWTMYLAYGDTRLLERAVPEHARSTSSISGRTAGDKLLWNTRLALRRLARLRHDARRLSRRDDGQGSHRDGVLRALHRSARARRAGARQDGRRARLSRSVRAHPRCVERRSSSRATGRVGSNTQTAYALALQFHLLPDSSARDAGERLAANVREIGHLTTGFLGTPYLTDALTETRPSRRGVPAAAEQEVSVVAVSDHAGRDDDLGALGRCRSRTAASRTSA